jgi:hypothetical protein
VISVIGHTRPFAKKSNSIVPSRPSKQQDCRAESASPDDHLIATSQHFRRKLREWIEQIGNRGIEIYDEKAEAGRALHALRMEWGNSLATLRSIVPCTIAGANEKLSAAQIFLAFSCEADGAAIEFLALATRELDKINAGLRNADQTQASGRPNAYGPFWWLERLTRRA